MTKFLNISTDTTLGGSSASDVLVVSQKAIKTYVDNHSGGGSVAIDNSTITKNTSDEIQAAATINANTATGATNPIYDWVGTLAEYTSQAVATNHPDWVCLITDDCEATAYEAYTQSQCNNLFVQKGHQVIDFQEPTAANNYTWYRKYADGWVEQGGQVLNLAVGQATSAVVFPVGFSDGNYTLTFGTFGSGFNAGEANFRCTAYSATGATFYNNSGSVTTYKWYACGMAA